MKYILLTILLFLVTTTQAQVFTKPQGQPAIKFIKANTPVGLIYPEPHGELDEYGYTKQMFATNEWTKDTAYFAFYAQVNNLQEGDVVFLGYLYVPDGSRNYHRIFIDTFEVEGSAAEITSIFYANADKDKPRELVMLIKWPQRHYDIKGDFYETRIYDNIGPGQYPKKLTFLKWVSIQVSGGFEGDREGEKVVSKFKTAKEVKEGLKKLTY